MPFKLGSEKRDIKSSKNVKIIRSPLDKGTSAEAKNDGTIVIDPSIPRGSAEERRVIKHEVQHVKDMQSGRAGYGDNWVMWEDKIYVRKNGYIDGPNGRWPEGDANHPWEQVAIAAENK
tara:strand:- start:262 stop:618 length:357 start_codon:yes stop_codon:yes gene_type:complete